MQLGGGQLDMCISVISFCAMLARPESACLDAQSSENNRN